MHPDKSSDTFYNVIAVLYFPFHLLVILMQIVVISYDISTSIEFLKSRIIARGPGDMMIGLLICTMLILVVFAIPPLKRILYKFPWLTPFHIMVMFSQALIASTYYVLVKAYEVLGGGNNTYIFLALLWFIIGRGIMSFVLKKHKILYIGEFDNAS